MVFWRQKVLLALLETAPNKRASRTQFIKWLFLLKKEEDVDRYGSFYDFVPYKYGPFSFLAYRDIAELERFGWIESDDGFLKCICSEPGLVKRALPSTVLHSIKSNGIRFLYNKGKAGTDQVGRGDAV